jgi:hypothetical protein
MHSTSAEYCTVYSTVYQQQVVSLRLRGHIGIRSVESRDGGWPRRVDAVLARHKHGGEPLEVVGQVEHRVGQRAQARGRGRA